MPAIAPPAGIDYEHDRRVEADRAAVDQRGDEVAQDDVEHEHDDDVGGGPDRHRDQRQRGEHPPTIGGEAEQPARDRSAPSSSTASRAGALAARWSSRQGARLSVQAVLHLCELCAHRPDLLGEGVERVGGRPGRGRAGRVGRRCRVDRTAVARGAAHRPWTVTGPASVGWVRDGDRNHDARKLESTPRIATPTAIVTIPMNRPPSVTG